MPLTQPKYTATQLLVPLLQGFIKYKSEKCAQFLALANIPQRTETDNIIIFSTSANWHHGAEQKCTYIIAIFLKVSAHKRPRRGVYSLN